MTFRSVNEIVIEVEDVQNKYFKLNLDFRVTILSAS